MAHDRQSDSRRAKPPAIARLRRAAKAAKSGLKRYPKALLASVRDPRGRKALPPASPTPPALPDLARHELAAVWLGHASMLLRIAGMNILADPVMAHRIGLSIGPLTFGLPRSAPAPLREEHLPPIDLILISHAHFDHLDKPTLKRLAAINPKTPVITARRTAGLIPRGFAHVHELDWDRDLHIGDLSIAALRPAHWGARTAVDRRRGYNSYILRERGSGRGGAGRGGVLLAGDTALTNAFDGISNLALAVLGIGAYGNWTHAHATPEEAWSMFRACGAAHLLPVHHSTFPMGDEHIDEPMQRLIAAAGDEHHRVIRAAPGAVWAA